VGSLTVLAGPADWGRAEGAVAGVEAALELAAGNRHELELALERVADEQRAGLEFLLQNMPAPDLQSLSAEFLLENVDYAYRAWREAPWHDGVPQDVFLNDILPYANINERRDRWRKDFFDRFRPLIADAQTPSQAAARLNQKIFPLLNVRYSTRRPKADQSPYESIEAGLASCTGLSILLIDACRAVGVPARFVGTPLWSDRSGNHSWVEVWDDGWHFTGAAEPAEDELDKAWFVDRAATAKRDEPRHAIYAVSFRGTPLRFPLIWDRSIDYVRAVNVTDRYLRLGQPTPEGQTPIMIRVIDPASRDRCVADFCIRDAAGQIVYQGQSKDERFDANDHVTVPLPRNQVFELEVRHADQVSRTKVETGEQHQLITIEAASATTDVVESLAQYLQMPAAERETLDDQPFAQKGLSKAEAERVEALLWQDHVQMIRRTRAEEIDRRELQYEPWRLRFGYKVFGTKPDYGRSLYISMHGGGNAPTRVNDRQWENQQRLYEPSEGIYLSPRAPTDTWDLWHQGHIDPLLTRLIEDLIVLEDVNPDRVYLLGYSAGGDGVFQLAPRMADQLAAAAMMAGHPNETSPLGLRNLPFTLHMGEKDAAYNRNQVAAEWSQKLDELQQADPQGYIHWVQIHAGKGHWMDREDAAALPWMAQYRRNPFPDKVVWQQDDVTHRRFYWLAVPAEQATARSLIVATCNGQRIDVRSDQISQLTIRVHDAMLDLDQPVEVWWNDQQVFGGSVPRRIATIAATLADRGDPRSVYRGEIPVQRP
jgi:predicted peptidase